MRELLSTESVDESERLDYWNHVASIVFWPLRVGMPPHSNYLATLSHEVDGALELSTVSGYQHEVHHTGSHAVSTGGEKVALGLQVDGFADVAQDGRSCRVQPGEAALFDPSRPYSMRWPEGFTLAVFSLPAGLVRSLGGTSQRLTARPLQACTDASAAALSYLLCLARLTRQRGIHDSALSNGSLAIAASLLRDLGGEPVGPAPADESYEQALAFIDLHLQDPALAPADIAAACHVSLRALYRLFEAKEQTVAAVIRDRRLAQARVLLESMHPSTSVAWVGTRVGFASAEHFTRAFRAAHELPPAAWRARQRG